MSYTQERKIPRQILELQKRLDKWNYVKSVLDEIFRGTDVNYSTSPVDENGVFVLRLSVPIDKVNLLTSTDRFFELEIKKDKNDYVKISDFYDDVSLDKLITETSRHTGRYSIRVRPTSIRIIDGILQIELTGRVLE